MKLKINDMNKNSMVFFSKDIFKSRICVRNQYSEHFNDFDLLRIGKSYFTERIEYKFGILGIVFVLIRFKSYKININDPEAPWNYRKYKLKKG
jgi:hypothetical protein